MWRPRFWCSTRTAFSSLWILVLRHKLWWWCSLQLGYSIESWTLASSWSRCPTRVALRSGAVSSYIASFSLRHTTFFIRVLSYSTSNIQILTFICVLFDKYCHTRFLFLRPLLSMFHRTSSIQILTFTRFFYLRPLLSMFHTTSSSQILWNLPSMLKYSREFL